MFRYFKTPDGRVHAFPTIQAEAAKRMLENFWLPEEYANVYPKPIPERKVLVKEITPNTPQV